ncbi:hypothetical protein SpCBS45565_g00983 [Spizellomyces sp. 'palustris']|nr:hypothetical protein SpCBS45565_g00983 [Spizellomyces sp. 'palustris']
MSIRMAVVLNMYIDPDVEEVHGPLPWLVKEARRRMWFTLCALDVTDCSPEDRARIIAERDQPILDRTPFIHDYTRRVRVPAPDHMWESVHTEEGLPAIGAFDPVQDLHCGDASGRLTRLYARIQILGIGVSDIVQNVSSNPRNPGRRELMDTAAGTSQSHAQTAQPLLSPEHQELIDQIEQELHTWLTYLPPWARSIDHHTIFVPSTISRHPPPWQLLSLHIMYHACYVALHLPTLLKARRNGVRSTHPSLTHVNATTRHHTRRISQLIHKVKNLDPSAKYITLIICYFTFYSAVALALALSDEYNREDTAELRAELDIHIWWMSVFGERWYMGGYLVRVIEGLAGGLAGDQATRTERER